MAEELTNSQEIASEEIVPAEETTDVPDADLEDTDSYLLRWSCREDRLVGFT